MMKKLLFLAILLPVYMYVNAQDEIVKWTFPNNLLSDTVQNGTNNLNLNQVIRAEGTSVVAMKNGATTYAAQATNWDNGMGSKNWNIRFLTTGYTQVKISSKQTAGGNNGGPKDFKMQYKIGISGSWTDLAGGIVTLANDWTTGVINNLELPAECQNQADTVYVRWIMTTNTDVRGGDVTAAGISKIDDIIVTGILSTGIDGSEKQQLKSFPNPSVSAFSISVPDKSNTLEIFDNIGKQIFKTKPENKVITIDLPMAPGVYFIKTNDSDKVRIIKHIVR